MSAIIWKRCVGGAVNEKTLEGAASKLRLGGGFQSSCVDCARAPPPAKWSEIKKRGQECPRHIKSKRRRQEARAFAQYLIL
jgi:hypothetical protein